MGRSRQREGTVGAGYALYVGALIHRLGRHVEAREQQGILCYVFEIHLEMGSDCPVGPAQILFMNG